MRTKGLKIIAGLALMLAPTVGVAEIANYDFVASSDAASADANVVAGTFDPTDIFGAAGGRSTYQNASGVYFIRSSATTDYILDAIAGDDYLSFTITPNGGYSMNLTNLTFDYGYTSTASNQIGKILTAYLLTDIDGFTNELDVLDSQTITVTNVAGASSIPYQPVTIDLSGVQFQDVATATEFRIYLTDDATDNDVIHRLDNVVLDGLVVLNGSVGDTTAVLDPEEIAIVQTQPATPSTVLTGSVDFVYTCATNLNITSIAVTDESDPGSFTVLSAVPQTLDPTNAATSVPLEFEFNNLTANLTWGSATGLVNIAWSEEGSGITNDIVAPISVFIPEPATAADVNPDELIMVQTNAATSSTVLTGSVDFVYSCATNLNILAITVANESDPGSFTVLSAAPQTLDPAAGAAVPLEIEFNNLTANLTYGLATGQVSIDWSEEGSGVTNETVFPVTAFFTAPVLAEYAFDSSATPTFTDTNAITAGDFIVGPGLTNVPVAAGYSSGGGDMYARSFTTAPENTISITNALRDDDYFTVTVSPTLGSVVNLSSLELDYGYTRNGSFDGKRFKIYVLTSIDGFDGVEDIVGSKVIDIGGNTSTAVSTGVLVDLSGVQFQNITTDTEFRFYLSDTTGANDYLHRIDDVVLRGTKSLDGGTGVEITSIELLGSGDIAISWDTLPGQAYNTLTNGDLSVSAGWAVDQSVIGDGGTLTVTNSPDADQLFYKVEAGN